MISGVNGGAVAGVFLEASDGPHQQLVRNNTLSQNKLRFGHKNLAKSTKNRVFDQIQISPLDNVEEHKEMTDP